MWPSYLVHCGVFFRSKSQSARQDCPAPSRSSGERLWHGGTRIVWAGDAISGSQPVQKRNFTSQLHGNCYAPCLLWMSSVFQVAPCFAGSSSKPYPCLGVRSPKSEFELRGLLCWSGACESKDAAKAVREIRGRAPMPDLLASASRPPAELMLQSNLLAKQNVLRRKKLLVALLWHLFSLWVVVWPLAPPHFPVPRVPSAAPTPAAAPPIAMDFHQVSRRAPFSRIFTCGRLCTTCGCVRALYL